MATRRRTQAEKNPASPPASPSAVRRRQSSVGVDTSDLSDDPSTLPIVPKVRRPPRPAAAGHAAGPKIVRLLLLQDVNSTARSISRQG